MCFCSKYSAMSDTVTINKILYQIFTAGTKLTIQTETLSTKAGWRLAINDAILNGPYL